MIETKTIPPANLIRELPTSTKFESRLSFGEELQGASDNAEFSHKGQEIGQTHAIRLYARRVSGRLFC